MKTLHTRLNSLLGLALLLVFVLSSCAKDEVLAPTCTAGVAKGLSIPAGTDEPANGASDPDSRGDADGGSISDDGDDVGDGERNKKKKPN